MWILPLSLLLFLTATDLINNLLQVKMRKRYSVDKSLSHPWLQVTTLLLLFGVKVYDSATRSKILT